MGYWAFRTDWKIVHLFNWNMPNKGYLGKQNSGMWVTQPSLPKVTRHHPLRLLNPQPLTP